MAAGKDKRKGWRVDFVFQQADGRKERVRKQSPVQTRRGAEEYERQLRQEMLDPRPEGKEVPVFSAYAEEFMRTYAETNNKPSEVGDKRTALKRYLLPKLASKRLDAIGVRDIELIKAGMIATGLPPRRSTMC
jgi:hypothetical protein